ncbi:MAG: hypothetical protein VCG02_07425 [Verrucomicrobiota bacterium]
MPLLTRYPSLKKSRYLLMRLLVPGLGFVLLGSGCASTNGYARQKVMRTETIQQAVEELPEEQLIDVGLTPSRVPELTEKQLKKQGSSLEIREAEKHFVPYHLKNTMQNSSNWGAVRVVPAQADDLDLLVHTEVLESNGEHFKLRAKAVDATGQVWFKRQYESRGISETYENNKPGEKGPYQEVYNRIANDLNGFRKRLSPAEIQLIRRTAEMRFAAEFAPDAFGHYVQETGKGQVILKRVPSDEDAMIQRVRRVRERELMYVETVNEYYEVFYTQMWDPYENWRKFNLVERLAVRQVRRDAWVRTTTGILMIAAAIALEVGDVDNTASLRDLLILGGGQVVVSGINISQQAEMHRVAIGELSESFGAEMKPVTIDFENKTYELSGSVDEQYTQLMGILRRLYLKELGIDEDLAEPLPPAVQP